MEKENENENECLKSETYKKVRIDFDRYSEHLGRQFGGVVYSINGEECDFVYDDKEDAFEGAKKEIDSMDMNELTNHEYKGQL